MKSHPGPRHPPAAPSPAMPGDSQQKLSLSSIFLLEKQLLFWISKYQIWVFDKLISFSHTQLELDIRHLFQSISCFFLLKHEDLIG